MLARKLTKTFQNFYLSHTAYISWSR